MATNAPTREGPAIAPEGLVRSRPLHALLGKVLLNVGFLGAAVAAFAAYEHFRLAGESTPAAVSLVGAALLGLMPLRALLDELLDVERKVLHLVHGLGGIAVIGLAGSGALSGNAALSHGAMAPFAIMGAVQALMHADHPRSAEQAEALRGFVARLPEVRQFASAGDLASPANAQRAVTVLSDLLAGAQRLGESELHADPGVQSALQRASTHVGVGLGLDAVDNTLRLLSANPAAASALPELRRRLAEARSTLAGRAPSGRRTASTARSRHGRCAANPPDVDCADGAASAGPASP